MTEAKVYPHKQTFNVKSKPNKKLKAWYKVPPFHNNRRQVKEK